jgi:hypothetical protein
LFSHNVASSTPRNELELNSQTVEIMN